MTEKQVRKLVESGQGGWVPRGLLGPTSDTLRHIAADAGWEFYQVVLFGVSDKDDLMKAYARALHLPEWFGRNWDALAEVLLGLAPDYVGALLRVKGTGEVPQRLAETMNRVLADRVDESSKPLIVVCDPPLPRIAIEQAARDKVE